MCDSEGSAFFEKGCQNGSQMELFWDPLGSPWDPKRLPKLPLKKIHVFLLFWYFLGHGHTPNLDSARTGKHILILTSTWEANMQPTISKEANRLQERPQKQVIQKNDESSNYSSSPVSGRASRGLDLVAAEGTMLSEKYTESKRRGDPTKKHQKRRRCREGAR